MPNVQKKGLSSMTARNKYCRIAMDGPQLEPPARHLPTMPTRPMVLSLVGLMFFSLLFGCASTGAVKQEDMGTITTDENGNQEIRFTGAIRNIHFGVPFDAHNQILVDAFGEKLVIFGSGGSRGRQPELPWGRLVGFDFPDSIGSDDFSGYNQAVVHVYCAVDFASGPNMEKVPIYTLYGKKDYFVCLSRENRGCPE
jgi:hypothetical protein